MCTKNDINSLMGTIKIINIIKIVVPIILILYVVLKLLKSKELDKRLIKIFIINTSLALLIFVLPNIVFYFNNYLGNKTLSCMKKIDKNVINVMNIINKKKVQLSEKDYEKAYNYYLKIKDDDIKNELESDLDELKYASGYEDINAKMNLLIQSYKENLDKNTYNEIMDLYEKTDNKENFAKDIENIKYYVDIISKIELLKANYDRDKYNDILSTINDIKDGIIKDKLNNILANSDVLKKLDVKEGVSSEIGSNFGYEIAIPKDATEDMPLMIGLNGLSASSIYEKIMPNLKTKFIYAAAYTKASTSWQDDGSLNKVIKLIDEFKEKYKINSKKIVVVGYSIGAIGTWEIVSTYPNVFSDAFIVSCWGPVFKAESFLNTRVFAYSGDTGDDESGYAAKMQGYVEKINAIGGHATYTKTVGATHRQSGATLYDVDAYKKVFDE